MFALAADMRHRASPARDPIMARTTAQRTTTVAAAAAWMALILAMTAQAQSGSLTTPVGDVTLPSGDNAISDQLGVSTTVSEIVASLRSDSPSDAASAYNDNAYLKVTPWWMEYIEVSAMKGGRCFCSFCVTPTPNQKVEISHTLPLPLCIHWQDA